MTTLSVPDMSCGHCKAAVLTALAAVPQSGAVKVDLDSRTVTLSGPAPLTEVLQALDHAGYPAQVV